VTAIMLVHQRRKAERMKRGQKRRRRRQGEE
jgi:hypothetical protein